MCGLLVWQAAEARINGDFYYGLTAKDRSDAPNEVYSTLGLNIKDNLITSNSQTIYGLESRLNYDHKENVTNDQYSGFFTGEYMFIQRSLWWNYFGEVGVIPLNTGAKIDGLTSQNFSTVSTGPTISWWKNLRGSVDLTALASITKYSESNLDSKGNDITLDYFYPYSEIMSVTYSLDYEEVRYDDVSHAINDFDLLTAGITINRGTVNSSFELILEYGDLENNNNSSSERLIELNMGYQINGFSNIAIEISDTLQTADEFNRLDDNPDNAIFVSGVFRNERVALRYEYAANDTRYDFEIYTNNLETIFDTVQTTEKISGVVFGFAYDIINDLNLFLGLETTDEETLDVRTDEVVVAATYTRWHSERLYSGFELSLENERVNDVSSNDTIFRYRLTSALF